MLRSVLDARPESDLPFEKVVYTKAFDISHRKCSQMMERLLSDRHIMYRKIHPACPGSRADSCVKSSVPAHLDVHPLRDYEPVGRVGDLWVGLHREKASRRMAHVQRVVPPRLSDLQRLSEVAHRNLARPVALYFLHEEAYIAWEYVDLDVLDLPPVTVAEAAAIMAQVSGHIPFGTICVGGF